MPRSSLRHWVIALALIVAVCTLAYPASGSAEADSVAVASDAPAVQPASVVNINTASAEELERLPRIGPTKARAILALRTRLSRFTRLDELLRVKGIGRATFRKLRPLLTLQGPTTLATKSARGQH